ncbi:hypothetical protein BDV19DRAFT_388992 [Aspergillus venezuelensis]
MEANNDPNYNSGEGDYGGADGYQTTDYNDINNWSTSTTEGYNTATAMDNPSTTESATATDPAILSSSTQTSVFSSQTATSSTESDSTSNDPNPDGDGDSDGGGSGGGGGLSTNTKIAIAVPVSIVGAAILAAIIFFFLRRRRRRNNRLRGAIPVISTHNLETSSSAFLPSSHTHIAPVPTPEPIAHRSVPANDIEIQPPHPSGTETPVGVAVTDTSVPVNPNTDTTATRGVNLDWRTSTERAEAAAAAGITAVGADGRPRSPFSHPDDDAMSDISDINDREAMMRSRGVRDDDMSSVSSFEDDNDGDENRRRRSRT